MQYATSLNFTRGERINFALQYLLSIVFILSSLAASAQPDRSRILEYDTKPRPGKVWLSDGTELVGGIIFNDNEGIVLLNLEDRNEMKAFNARTLSRFQFDGGSGQPDQLFYALEYHDPETGFNTTAFFEVLKELKEFLVLLRIDPVKTERIKRKIDEEDVRRGFQKSTIFFIGPEGELEPYAEYIIREKDGLLFDIEGKRNRFINSDLFEKYTGQHYAALEKYAEHKGIHFKKKEHLIELLDYYEKLVSSETN